MTTPIRPGGQFVSPIERGGIRLGPTQTGPSFGDALKGALGDVAQMEENARDTISMFLRGEPVDVHQVMMAAEEASISIEMLAEIRNKLTDAYRSIMNMQI